MRSYNPFITCAGTEGQLITSSFNVSTLATAASVSQNFTVPTARGRVKRIQINALSQTLADLVSRTISVSINGVQVIQNESLAKFSTFFQDTTREYGVDWAEKSTVTVDISGGSAVIQTVNVVLFFVD